MKVTKQDILQNSNLTEEEKQIILLKVEESRKLDEFLNENNISTAVYRPSKKRGKNGK